MERRGGEAVDVESNARGKSKREFADWEKRIGSNGRREGDFGWVKGKEQSEGRRRRKQQLME